MCFTQTHISVAAICMLVELCAPVTWPPENGYLGLWLSERNQQTFALAYEPHPVSLKEAREAPTSRHDRYAHSFVSRSRIVKLPSVIILPTMEGFK